MFSTHEEVGAGLVIWHPKGMLLRHLIEDFESREHLRRGYHMVMGPEILRTDLWERSGHFDNYRENMYFTDVEDQSYGIKPMNCLAHMLIYKSKIRSYRDLPMRYFELGTVHRHERSGVLHGLTRVREFTQDDAHIICTPEQLHDEIRGVLDFVRDVMAIFRFDYDLEVSTRPEKSIGTDADWDLATSALIQAVEQTRPPLRDQRGRRGLLRPEDRRQAQGRPGAEVAVRHHPVRLHPAGALRPDYVGRTGNGTGRSMIHRVILGAIERFIGVLIEHFAGAFPDLAGSGAGHHPDGDRPKHPLRGGAFEGDVGGGCPNRRAISETKSWDSRSGRPSSRRSPTC